MNPQARSVARENIIAELSDWERRLNELYATIDAWLAELPYETRTVRADVAGTTDEVLIEYDVEPGSVPAYAIYSGDNRVAFMPIALWVIGGNGRIDIITNSSRYILLDMGGVAGEPSRWVVVQPKERNTRRDFSKDVLELLIKDERPFE